MNTSAAAIPYRKKSYHSMLVAMKLETITGLIEEAWSSCCPPTLPTLIA